MVLVTSIQAGGTLQELSVPAKSADVLEWLRTKLKQPGLQFQGKIQDKDKESWVTVFAESGSEDDDEAVNQHVLGGNFQDEVFVGCIVVMLSKNSNADNYDKSAAAYTNLKPADYETIYSSWTFEGESSDEEEAEAEAGAEDDVSVDDDVPPADDEQEDNVEDEAEAEAAPTRQR